MSVFIISVLTALCVSAFCSLMESILLSISPSQIAEITTKSPKCGAIWSSFKKKIDPPISAILILNTSAHTIGATVAGAALSNMTEGSPYTKYIMWIFSAVFTFCMLQYTEILPKTLGVRYNKQLAYYIGYVLVVMVKVLRPFIWLTRFLNRPFEPKGHKVEYASAVDELRYMAVLARQNRQIGTKQEEIIVATARLSRQKAKDVMIPLTDVVFLSSGMSLREAIEIAHLDAHTRFPVFDGENKNKIIGYVNFKEIISHQKLNPTATAFREIVRPIAFVDSEAPASDLLRLFTFQHEHLAMIQNKRGECLGMVTLEDIIEELIGELEDEFDSLPHHVHHLPNQVLLLGGGCKMESVRRKIAIDVLHQPLNKGTDIASEKDDLKTLDEWLEDRLGHNPVRGDRISLNGIEFNVRRVRRGRVFDVQIRKVPDYDGEPDANLNEEANGELTTSENV